jgi:hypothetical protein
VALEALSCICSGLSSHKPSNDLRRCIRCLSDYQCRNEICITERHFDGITSFSFQERGPTCEGIPEESSLHFTNFPQKNGKAMHADAQAQT